MMHESRETESEPLLGDGPVDDEEYEEEPFTCGMPTGADVNLFFKTKFPPLRWLPNYKAREDLGKDIVAGLTVGVMAVPQAMSYATVAGLPPVYGLYNAFVGLLPYPFFGTSAHLISGPTAVMSILVGSLLPTTWDGSPVSTCHSPTPSEIMEKGWTSEDDTCGERIKLALLLALVAGMIQIAMGCFKLGMLVDLISEPVIAGFTSGAAFLIAATQFSNMLGIPKCHVYDDKADSYSLPGCHFHQQVAWIAQCEMGSIHSYKKHPTEASCAGGYFCPKGDAVVTNSSTKEVWCYHNTTAHAGNATMQHLVGKKASSCNPPDYFQISWETMIFGIACICLLEFFTRVVKKKNKMLGNLGPLCCLLTGVPFVYYLSPAHLTGKPGDILKHLNIKAIGEICKSDSIMDFSCLPSPMNPLSSGEVGESHFDPSFNDLVGLIGPAIAVALIGYMESMTIAKTVLKLRSKLASQGEPLGSFSIRMDPSQELIALGSCNLAVSCLRGYPVTGSFSRTAVNGDSGARSPFACLTCSVVVGGALVFLAKFLQYLPKVVLAAIVLISIVKLVDYHEALFLWRVSKRDFLVFATIFLCTVFLGVEIALMVGILGNWTLYLAANERAQAAVMGVNANGEIVDVVAGKGGVSPRAETTHSHIVVLKHGGDLAFCNAQYFKDMVEEGVDVCKGSARVIIIDCSSMNTIDASGIHAIRTIANELSDNKVLLLCANLTPQCKKTMRLAKQNDEELQSGTHRWDTVLHGKHVPRADGNPALMMFTTVDAAIAFAMDESSRAEGANKGVSSAEVASGLGTAKILRPQASKRHWKVARNTLRAVNSFGSVGGGRGVQ